MKETMKAIKAVWKMSVMIFSKACFEDYWIDKRISAWVKKPGWKAFWSINSKAEQFVGKKAYALANRL